MHSCACFDRSHGFEADEGKGIRGMMCDVLGAIRSPNSCLSCKISGTSTTFRHQISLLTESIHNVQAQPVLWFIGIRGGQPPFHCGRR